MLTKTRLETDSIGTLEIPAKAYYGVQSLRGKLNFHITGRTIHPVLIRSLALIKKAAAMTNMHAHCLEESTANAIIQACDELIDGQWQDQFIVDALQGGAGTSANMNANEVIANRAIELLGGVKGDYQMVSPIDHVNRSQSTNDVFPTAGKLTILALLPQTITQLTRLYEALEKKAAEFNDVIKIGRTQLQDAVPVRLGQSFHAYASVVKRDIARLETAKEAMYTVNIGGTAIGTAINAPDDYLQHITDNLAKVTGFPLRQADDLVDATQNLDGFVVVSGALKTCAVSLSKIANDLRLLASGPKTGLGEITLPAKQNGSSIMPGKVNPVIPEIVSQVAFNIIGNDFAVTMAAEGGQLELNAFEPVIFYNIFESIETLGNVAATFVDNCINGITANRQRCAELLNQSVSIITVLCPYIGYQKAADIVKRSLKTNTPPQQILLEEGLFTAEELANLMTPKEMIRV